MLEYPLLMLFPAAMLYAAVMDFFTMTIPNKISVALVAGFVVVALLAGMSWQGLLDHLGAGLVVLVASIFMFARGWFGGGDAKLMSAAALWFGFDGLIEYLLLVTVLGGFLATSMLLYRQIIPPMWIKGMEWAERLHNENLGIPYGTALAGAALWLFPTSQVFLMHGT